MIDTKSEEACNSILDMLAKLRIPRDNVQLYADDQGDIGFAPKTLSIPKPLTKVRTRLNSPNIKRPPSRCIEKVRTVCDETGNACIDASGNKITECKVVLQTSTFNHTSATVQWWRHIQDTKIEI